MSRRLMTAIVAVVLIAAVREARAAEASAVVSDSAVSTPDSTDAPGAGDVRRRLSAPT